jgi:hypothetical protein|tara:strand:+ start:281 stop:508 length:228 start_codon:yes stop_codon:yes gene_type:complete
MALLELDSKKRTSLLNARHSFDEAITALDKAHQELISVVSDDRLATTKIPLLDRSNFLLEEATDLLIDVKEAAWT